MRFSKKYVFLILSVLFIVATVPVFSTGLPEAETQQLRKATLRLNWKLTGPHVAYYYGVQKGFFKQEGIDLELKEGNGTVTTAQMVDNKSDTFGLADAAALIPMVEKGMPIKCIAMVSPKTSLSVVARKDSGITKLKDLEGKKLAVTAGDSLTQLWPAVVAVNNLEASKINLVYVDAAAKVPVVLEKKADALLGSSSDQNFILEAQGVPTVTLDFADFGVNVLNLGIWVHQDTIKNDPELIRSFLRGLKKSFDEYLKDPEAALVSMLKDKPEIDPVVTRNQATAYLKQLKSPNCPTIELLYNCPQDWEQTLQIMKTYRELDLKLKPTDYYTNEFFTSK